MILEAQIIDETQMFTNVHHLTITFRTVQKAMAPAASTARASSSLAIPSFRRRVAISKLDVFEETYHVWSNNI